MVRSNTNDHMLYRALLICMLQATSGFTLTGTRHTCALPEMMAPCR